MEEWYTNKELFEQMLAMKDDIQGLRAEMRETREIIRKYNGLRKKLDVVEDRIEQMEAKAEGKNAVLEAIRNWGGWLLAILSLLLNYFI